MSSAQNRSGNLLRWVEKIRLPGRFCLLSRFALWRSAPLSIGDFKDRSRSFRMSVSVLRPRQRRARRRNSRKVTWSETDGVFGILCEIPIDFLLVYYAWLRPPGAGSYQVEGLSATAASFSAPVSTRQLCTGAARPFTVRSALSIPAVDMVIF
jgi:hypothetical protein